MRTLVTIPRKGAVAYAPTESLPVVVQRTWSWPFPYAECLTAGRELIAVPLSRLTEIEWEFDA
ncbi:hypothetical protein F5X71_34765 [Nocardia brasiliensis]|uniref:Uncharacterized protein n=1 Tax=Nocardia brasiliensis TaxID=37326 RepID=A0A6G9Y0Q8_NOCBR|nr:hypothetical protein [Nocardia brasiliensis]QIS06788.1 hypothetical protein F5X71_34765 [Nocardia brasiliensis]